MLSDDDFELDDDEGGGGAFLDASGLSLLVSSFSLVDFGGLKYLSKPFGASLDVVRILNSFKNASYSDNFSPFFARNATSCLSCERLSFYCEIKFFSSPH